MREEGEGLSPSVGGGRHCSIVWSAYGAIRGEKVLFYSYFWKFFKIALIELLLILLLSRKSGKMSNGVFFQL